MRRFLSALSMGILAVLAAQDSSRAQAGEFQGEGAGLFNLKFSVPGRMLIRSRSGGFPREFRQPCGKENWIIRQSQAGGYADRGINR